MHAECRPPLDINSPMPQFGSSASSSMVASPERRPIFKRLKKAGAAAAAFKYKKPSRKTTPSNRVNEEKNERQRKHNSGIRTLSCTETSCTESEECLACWFDNHEKAWAEDKRKGPVDEANAWEASSRPMRHYRALAEVLLNNGIETRLIANLIFQFIFECDPLSDYGEEIEAAAIAGMDLLQTKSHDTPLLLASQCGHVGAINALVYHRKVNLERRDETGRTSLVWAAANGHYDAVVALIAAGANVDTQDARGWTAIMFCARWGYDKCSKALLDAKADVSLQNLLGDRAFDMATDRLSTRTYRILQSSSRKREPPRSPTPNFQPSLFEPRGVKPPTGFATQRPQFQSPHDSTNLPENVFNMLGSWV